MFDRAPMNRAVGMAVARSRAGRAQAQIRDMLELVTIDDEGCLTVVHLDPADARRLAAALEAQADRADMGIPA